MDYEKENSNILSFSIPPKSIARVVGKQGAQIDQIAAETGAVINLDRDSNMISLRGSKAACSAAKKLIQEITQDSKEEFVIELRVERSLQAGLIGKGGSNSKSGI